MLTIVSGLTAAFSYAVADLLSLRVARTLGTVRVLALVLPVGLAVVLPVSLLRDGLPAGEEQWMAVGFAVAGGVTYLATGFTILAALKVGELSLVIPLVSLQSAFTVVMAWLGGERPTVLLALALAGAVVGGALAAYRGRVTTTAGAGWALLTAMLMALTMLFTGQTGAISWVSQIMWSRLASLAIFVPIAVLALRQQPERAAGGIRMTLADCGLKMKLLCVAVGLLDLAALSAMTVAVRTGPLAVAGVTVAQSATIAVLLGVTLLKERPRPQQVAGVVLTLIAVSVLSAT